MFGEPRKTGMALKPWAEDVYAEWKEIGGCSCFLGHPPCSSCMHEGHPLSLEENDEAWESELVAAVRAVAEQGE